MELLTSQLKDLPVISLLNCKHMPGIVFYNPYRVHVYAEPVQVDAR